MLPLPFTSRFAKGVALTTFSPVYFSQIAVDVFATMVHTELILEQESDIHILERENYYVCPKYPDLCSLPAGGKQTLGK